MEPMMTFRTAVSTLSALTLLTLAGAAHAQQRNVQDLPLSTAQKLAADTVAACAAKGYNVSASVVDRAGLLRAFARADNAGPHTIDASRAKAYTALSTKSTTQAVLEGSQKNPAAANLKDIPGFLLVAGGVPVKASNEVIGAIGVGGAPGGHLDEQCAVAALDSNAALLK